jgi:hypothetical protein
VSTDAPEVQGVGAVWGGLRFSLSAFRLVLASPSGRLPAMDNAPPTPQQILDKKHLRLLSIFYYVKGAISAVFACIPIIHVALGLILLVAPQVFGHGNNQPPALVGLFLFFLGSGLVLFGWTFAALNLIAGRCILRRKHYTYCFVVGCIELLSIPFGTILGVCTIMVLNRPGVRALFK